MSQPLRLLVLQLVLMLLVSVVAGYEVPDFSQLNSEIVLFLTPVGMFNNFTNEQSLLRPYYFETAVGTQLTLIKLGMLAGLLLILFFNFVMIVNGLRRR